MKVFIQSNSFQSIAAKVAKYSFERFGCHAEIMSVEENKILKDKLNKRLLPIEVIKGDLENDIITTEKDKIGKVLINDNYPYALIKVKNEKIDFDKTFTCGSAKIKVIKPDWLQIT